MELLTKVRVYSVSLYFIDISDYFEKQMKYDINIKKWRNIVYMITSV